MAQAPATASTPRMGPIMTRSRSRIPYHRLAMYFAVPLSVVEVHMLMANQMTHAATHGRAQRRARNAKDNGDASRQTMVSITPHRTTPDW